ncbi:TPA: ead/Ea22-like family protein [Raoultella ornithinolytica]
MKTDITELAQSLKAAAEKATQGNWRAFKYHDGRCGIGGGHHDEIMVCEHISKERPHDAMFIALANPANIIALVEALEKAQQSVELVDLQRDKIKRLESDLWDKEQLRKVHSEKSFELEGKVRELEARNQKDFVWRGEEIGRLNDEVDELKEKLESRTVKLPDDAEHDIMAPVAAYLSEKFKWDGSAARWDGCNEYDVLADRVKYALRMVIRRAAGIKVEAE